jgi:hypothetical protein
VETQHLCPASPSRGGLPGLAGVTTRPAGYPSGGLPPAVERQLHLLTLTLTLTQPRLAQRSVQRVERPPPSPFLLLCLTHQCLPLWLPHSFTTSLTVSPTHQAALVYFRPQKSSAEVDAELNSVIDTLAGHVRSLKRVPSLPGTLYWR